MHEVRTKIGYSLAIVLGRRKKRMFGCESVRYLAAGGDSDEDLRICIRMPASPAAKKLMHDNVAFMHSGDA